MLRKSLACISALSLVGSSLACADAESDKEKFLEYFNNILLRSARIDEETVCADLKKRFPFVEALSINLEEELAYWANVYSDHMEDEQSLLTFKRGLRRYLTDRINHVTRSVAYFQRKKSLSKFYKLLYESVADKKTSMLGKYFSGGLTKNEALDVINCFKSSSFDYDNNLLLLMAPVDAYFTGVDIDFSRLLGSINYSRFDSRVANILATNFTIKGVIPLDVLSDCLAKNKFYTEFSNGNLGLPNKKSSDVGRRFLPLGRRLDVSGNKDETQSKGMLTLPYRYEGNVKNNDLEDEVFSSARPWDLLQRDDIWSRKENSKAEGKRRDDIYGREKNWGISSFSKERCLLVGGLASFFLLCWKRLRGGSGNKEKNIR